METKKIISSVWRSVPSISHKALDRNTYAIFPPLFQVIQRCSVISKGHVMGDPTLHDFNRSMHMPFKRRMVVELEELIGFGCRLGWYF